MRWRLNESAKLEFFFAIFFCTLGKKFSLKYSNGDGHSRRGVEGLLEDALYNFFTETTSVLRAKERQIRSSTSMHK